MKKNSDTFPQITYHFCEYEGHEQEPLCRICVDEQCSKKTLVCSLCEEFDHKGHETLPLKIYLKKCYGEPQKSNKQKKSGKQMTPLYLINEIDEIHKSFFSVIENYKQDILNMFSLMETSGKMYFNKIREEIKHLIRLENPFEYIQKQSHTAAQLKRYFLQMTKAINLKDKEIYSLSNKLEQIMNMCKEKQTKLLEALKKQSHTLEAELQKISISLDASAMSTIKMPIFQWNQTAKGHKVILKGSIAEQSGMESSGQRFALMEPIFSQYGNKKLCWGIKVVKFVGWIGIGICLKKQISKANFHFHYTNTGHGSYLISTNGYSWSHSVKEFNSAFKSFQFNVNDTVYVQYDPTDKKLRFRKNKSNEKFSLDIVDPPADDDFCPCVNICSNGDSVQIINEVVDFP